MAERAPQKSRPAKRSAAVPKASKKAAKASQPRAPKRAGKAAKQPASKRSMQGNKSKGSTSKGSVGGTRSKTGTPAVDGLRPASVERLRLVLPVERFELSCGAQLLVSHRPGAPITAAQVHIRGGLALDPKGCEGLAFLTGALIPEGTEAHSEEQLADLLEPEGGSLSGDSTGLSGSIVSASWPLLLDLLGELLTTPTYPEDKVERQRGRLLQRLEVEREDHRVQAGQIFRRQVYGDHWLGGSERGTIESIRSIRRDQLALHHQSHWVASRAVIAVCGDVSGREVREFLEQRLWHWRRGEPIELPSPALPPFEPRAGGFRADRQQVQVCLGHLGIRRRDEDYVAALVMDYILGTGPGFTDRISKRLRDVEGLAYSVQANLHGTAGVQPGMFLATIGTSPDKLDQALTGFIEEIERIRVRKVRPGELELAIQYLTGSFVLGFERASRRAQAMIQAHRYGLPEDDLETLPVRIAAVTAKDILEVARTRLHPEALCLSVGGPIEPAEVPALLARAHAAAARRRK